MKKKLLILLGYAILVSHLAFSDVTEIMKVKLNFPGFAKIENTTTEYYKNLLFKNETNGDFKGEGFMTKMISKMYNGKIITITDLQEKMYYNINVEKKTYTKTPIEKLNLDLNTTKNEKNENKTKYKIIRNILKVTDLKEKKKINNFETKKYNIFYLLEVQNLETKAFSTDSILVDLYLTEDMSLFEKATKEKMNFTKRYLEILGIDLNVKDNESILGLNWLTMMKMFNNQEGLPSEYVKLDYSELKKLKGIPVVIDGKYFVRNSETEKMMKENKSSTTEDTENPNPLVGGFGNFLKNQIKNSSKEENKPTTPLFKEVMSYYIETQEIKFDNLNDDIFKIPSGYKEDK